MALSPMMKQYHELKEKYPGCLVMYRLGDFYEFFFEDAKTASKALGITLTGRDCGLSERAPMCGVPYHAVEGYIAQLVAKGFRVAICEQLSDPKLSKGIVERDVVRVITAGTATENLDAKKAQEYCQSATPEAFSAEHTPKFLPANFMFLRQTTSLSFRLLPQASRQKRWFSAKKTKKRRAISLKTWAE